MPAHIPGAVRQPLHDLADLSGPARDGIRPTSAAMEATFGRLGIGDHVQVVMYDQDTGLFASRMWWMLRYMGHDAAAVLDGGWAKWVREGRPARGGEETRKAARFTGRPRKERLVGLQDVAARLGDPSVLLVDARGPERFEGQSEPLDRTPGHIPGAVNHFYKRNVTDAGVMLPPDRLRNSSPKFWADGRRIRW
jgi:thiosulfate/3-mercaptopyruvate sulfurtransferase